MAILDLSKQLAALEEMRAALETALGSDENWRALRRVGRDSNGEADRRNRDARLTKALESNPLYVAWQHLSEAIRALRDADHAAKASDARDDLTHIRGISLTLARRLAESGITRYAKIAAWTAQDISIATEVLDLPEGEIERQNWIAQAKLLAARKSEVTAPPVADALAEPEPLAELEQDELEDIYAEPAGPEEATPEIEAALHPVEAGTPEMQATVTPEEDAPQIGEEPPETPVARVQEADTSLVADNDDIELPDDIRQMIRADAAGDAALSAASEGASMSNGKLTGKLAAIPSVEPIGTGANAAMADRIHKLETDVDAFNEAIEVPATQQPNPVDVPTAAPTAGAPNPPSRDDDVVTTVRMNAEPSEAKVTFIRRDPPASDPTQPEAAQPSDEPPQPIKETYLPPVAGEEAEVVIVKPEAPDIGRVRRFLKALSGD